MKAAAAKAVALTTAVLLPVVALLGSPPTYGVPEPSYTPYTGPLLPVEVPEPTATATSAPEPSYEVIVETMEHVTVPSMPPRRPVRQQVKVETKAKTPRRATSGGVHGVATWYCWPAYPSRCTAGYPSGGAYAAAGSELRRAFGGHYKGKVAYVNGVRVTLIDFCACGGDHVIDVYHLTWVSIPHPSNVTVTW